MSGTTNSQSTASANRTNWSGNLSYTAANFYTPTDVDELRQIVKKCKKIRALGTRHSFNSIADSPETQVSTACLNKIISLDINHNTIMVEAGIRYGELCTYLHEKGLALPNLASLPHISVAGACSTATHGSGINNGSLASAVSAIEFVNAAGDIVSMSRESDEAEFPGAVVNLGALGIVTCMTLDLEPAFNMGQWVYQNMPVKELEKNAQAILSAGYSVSLFTDWKNKNINQVWIKSKVTTDHSTEVPSIFYGAKPAATNLHPLTDLAAENCTDQMGIPGCWYERMPHFKMGFTPSSGKELQSEYFISIEHAYEGMMAIERLSDKIFPYLFISEIRAIAADDLWMSPFYRRTCIAFHFTWKPDWVQVQKLLPLIEEALAPFKPRPHWGKLFSIDPAVLQARIEKLNEFKMLLSKYDPDGKFRNSFIDRNLFGM